MARRPDSFVLKHPIMVATAFGIAAFAVSVPGLCDQPPPPRTRSILSFQIKPQINAATTQGPVMTMAVAGVPMNDLTSLSNIATALALNHFGQKALNTHAAEHSSAFKVLGARQTQPAAIDHPISPESIPSRWRLDYKEISFLATQMPCLPGHFVMARQCLNSLTQK